MCARELIVVSGVSGSGKSTALNALEDMGFFCIENLPAPLISNLVAYLSSTASDSPDVVDEGSFCNIYQNINNNGNYALLVDCRDSRFATYISQAVEQLKQSHLTVSVLLLDCDDDVLIRRFRETRRPHPLIAGTMITGINSASEDAIRKVLACERNVLAGVRELADHIIDTSAYTPHELRNAIERLRGVQADNLEIVIESFGFKYGVPQHIDLLIDVRFLPNPYFVSYLKDKTGKEPEIQEYVFGTNDAIELVTRYVDLLSFLIPRYIKEGKRCLTIGVGCTGGKHRSVAVSIKMIEKLRDRGIMSTIQHRDVERGAEK